MKVDPKMNKWLALIVLLLLLTVVYVLFFHQFVLKHMALNEDVDALNDSRQKYINQAAKTPVLKEQLRLVNERVGNNDAFLKADTNNLGNAEITSLFKQIFNEQGAETSECQIVSQQPAQDREPDQFEKVMLRVRMRCQYELFNNILASIETSQPALFVKDLRLETKNVSRYRRNTKKDDTPAPENLEIRFELFAYLKNPVEKDDEK